MYSPNRARNWPTLYKVDETRLGFAAMVDNPFDEYFPEAPEDEKVAENQELLVLSGFKNLDISSTDNALVEMTNTYKERLPYTVVPTLNGNCYAWTDIFIYSCLLAMATDALVQFTDDELNAWWSFVNFQDYHTHSATTDDVNGLAIGCTNPDVYNNSYVVAKNDIKIEGLFCQKPIFEVQNEQAWKSLDKAFMDLYECREIDDCKRIKGMYNASDCDLYTKANVIHRGRQVMLNGFTVYKK